MLIKFLSHGTGSGARASAYLMGLHDHTGAPRAGVAVLRGDPVLFAAVADSLPFQHRYASAVISWATEEAPTADEITAVLEDFEAVAFAGLEPEDVHLTAVQHDEPDGGVHVHILIPRVHLGTGKSFNPAPPGHRKDFDAVRDKHNHEKGWARPDDPLRARLLRPDFEAFKDKSDKTAIKKQITNHLFAAAEQRVISNAAELRDYLQTSLGCEITRTGADYTSIKPEGYPKAIRLKGELYGASWTAERTLEREAQAAARAGIGRGGEVSESGSRRAQERLRDACKRRAEYNRGRYPRRDKGIAQTDHRLDRPIEGGLGAGPERGQHPQADLQRLAQSLAGRGMHLRGARVGELGDIELDGQRGSAVEQRDQQRESYAGPTPQGGELRQGQGWQGLHPRPQHGETVQGEGQRQNGRGGELNDRTGADTDRAAGADGAAAPQRDDGLAAAALRATDVFGELAKAVGEHLERVRDALRQLTHSIRGTREEHQERIEQHGPEFGPDQPGYRSSTWVIEQQCGRSQELAGELDQGAALIADRAAELRREQRRGLSM
ncbi:relaxase/mobilization nuclease domain-containing protein [Aeromonas hydrophila]|nr:relaxase/mobilization nuclease domain-containing protein [Aeromonas hydrophila]MBW3804158.1 relaxase/mobilization nuclease domain-containing protein [Aeromonas hydrophila]MBW3821969.1 relaxase/mobilization nuclease domain-containing protein [Aeromonas hydrophila]